MDYTATVCRPEGDPPMITPIDVFCLAMFAGLMALEGNRGIIPALVDFLCVLGIAFAGAYGHAPLTEHIEQPSDAYLLLVGGLLLLTVVLSIFISRRLKVQVTAIEATFGAVIGMAAATVLTYMLFEWLSMRYGANSRIVSESLMAWQLHDFAGWHALVNFSRTLAGR